MPVTNNFIADDNSVIWMDGAYINSATPTTNQYYSVSNPIAVEPNQEYTLKIGAFGLAWYDQSGTFISISGSASDSLTMRTVMSPANATSCVASISIGKKEEFVMYEGEDFYLKTQIYGVDIVEDDKYWANKKIAWYGTSIPNGFPEQTNQKEFAYPNLVAKELGCDIQNYCISSGKIRSNDTQGNPVVTTGQSFTNPNSLDNYQTRMLNLIGTDLEPDLFVFDYGVNDYAVDPSDIDNIATYDFTSEDLNTFLGSYNVVLKELFNAKPTARVMLLTHYSDDDHANGKGYWKKLNDLIVAIGNHWSVPVLDLRKLTGVRNANGVNNIPEYCPDFLHPATDPDKKLINIITRLAKQFILDEVAHHDVTEEVVVDTAPDDTTDNTDDTNTDDTNTDNTNNTGGTPVIRSTAMYMKSGQQQSFISGDAGDVDYGRDNDFLTLDSPPVHDDGTDTINTTTNRFTDELGGQDYATGIILDWSSWNGSQVAGWQNNTGLTSSYMPFDAAKQFCDSFNLVGFSGWHLPSLKELMSICAVKYHCLDYAPFNSAAINFLWASNTLSDTKGIRIRQDTFEMHSAVPLTVDSAKPFPCRYFSLSLSNQLT